MIHKISTYLGVYPSLPITLLLLLQLSYSTCTVSAASPADFIDINDDSINFGMPNMFGALKGQGSSNGAWQWRYPKASIAEEVQKRDLLNFGKRETFYDQNLNGSKFLWLPQDTFEGKTFYDQWSFFNYQDPTNGTVNYVNRTEAFRRNFTYVQDDGKVIMKADMVTQLPLGAFRDSVRIQSIPRYSGGLFILDLDRAPWGCAVWPAFWTTNENWPWGGEIDIIEGVHDNEHNQIAWHTAPGCLLDPTLNYTGTVAAAGDNSRTDCNALINDNSGCGMTEWSRASYGPYFESQGGGVIAMKWDENGIAVYSFYRAAIPRDITLGTPNPSTWGAPSAILGPKYCNLQQFFWNHTIVFDITFCGVWAGNSYATTTCPGTCAERLMDPANFVNASWTINSLKVYRKQPVFATVDSGVRGSGDVVFGWWWSWTLVVVGLVSVGLHV